jgi:hypothetical protein
MSRRKAKQLVLAVRLFCVRCDGFCDYEVQAPNAAAAKYRAFKSAREAGYFPDPRSGFRDFLSRGFKAFEVRR